MLILKKKTTTHFASTGSNYCEKRTISLPKMIKLGITNRLKTCHYVPPDVMQYEINITQA